MKVDYKYIVKPLLGDIEESGDLVFVKDNSPLFSFGVIDGLGHGRKAHYAAETALHYLQENAADDPSYSIKEIHKLLVNSIGAVIGICNLDKETGILTTCGIGNITTRIIGNKSQKIIYQDGIVGLIKKSLRSQVLKLHPGDIILMYSDGIKENIDLLEIPNILKMSPEDIANNIFSKYSKMNDDASILTVKLSYD